MLRGCCVGFSLAVVSGGYSLVVGLLIVVAPLAAEHGIRAHKLHELQHVGSVAVAPGPWSTGSIVVVHGLSSKYSLKKKATGVSTLLVTGRQYLLYFHLKRSHLSAPDW